MTALIIGDSPLLAALKRHLKPTMWRVPCDGDALTQSQFLAATPPPADRHRYIFTSASGDWLGASRQGWTIYWCATDRLTPVGTIELPEQAMSMSLRAMVKAFWGVNAADPRLVGDLLSGHARNPGTVLYVTSASGGVGKTTSSRRLCERAGQAGIPSLLIDANMLQPSQRSFFDPPHQLDVRTIQDWHQGERAVRGANQGKRFAINYDIAFAPELGQEVTWRHYARYIDAARTLWHLIVVDLDRVSARDFDTPGRAASELILPGAANGDLVLVAVKAGAQTQADAMHMLEAFPTHDIDPAVVGIKDVLPVGMDTYQPYSYERVGTFLGEEHQSIQAGTHIAQRDTGWADPGLDYVRERTLAWAMPDHQFNPDQYKPADTTRRKGWFR